MLTDGDALISLPAGMAVPGGSMSPCAMARFILYLCLWMVLLLHCPVTACPKPCACYVPTELHCTFRYITAIPRQMAANVERVNLGYNSLVQIEENDFSGLHKMELLMLHSNEIQRIHENAFNDLHALQVLKMSYNKVRSLHKNTFHGLKSLIRLHMDHNKIEFMNPEALYGLNSLRLVHLEGNLLKQIHPDTFVTLRYMQIFKTSTVKHIYLSDNLFSSLPKDMFSYMPELETVYLNGNPWSCDCQLQWFAEWAEKSRDMIKCKRDRSYASGQQCPTCSSPSLYNGKELTEISTAELSCVKPSIDPSLKVRNITDSEEGDFTSISPQDFIAPIGSLILNMTDQAGNEANLACSVQRPSKMSPLTLDRSNGHTLLKTSLSTFLVCSIDYDHIQKLWGLLATYSDSPMRLKRDLLLTNVPHVSYSYKQISSEDDVFTNIEAELRAEPNWLMQDQVTFQLDRTATTLNTLHVRYIADAHIMLEQYDQKPLKYKWAMILKDNTTQTEHSAVTGGTVELDCQAIGEPTPVIEWILPDGSKVRAPYTSEEGRIIITKSGKFILRAVDTFDTGLYHCIGTNYHDADVLSFRIVVVNPDVEHESLNGAEISPFVGDTLYLPCDSSGIPRASVSWILPDHSVVHQSSKYRHIFSNGTLKMHELTDRDRGYFRCVAANSYGFDVLVVNVLTKAGKNRASSKAISLEDDDQEASGKGEFTAVTEHYMPLTTAQTIISQTSLVTTEKQLAKIKQKKTETKIQYSKNGNKPSKRARGQRRQFNQSNRRIDPQQWADLLEKTKKKSVISPIQEKKANTEKPKANHFEKVSGDGEETSGDDFVPTEEGFIILTTKMPTETTIYQLTPSKATKTKMPTDTNTHPLTPNKVTGTTSPAEATTPSIRTVKISPVATPKVIEIDRSELPNVNTEGKHLTTIPTTEITTTLRQSGSSGERHIPSKILTTSSTIFNLKSSHFITTTPTTSSFINITPEYPTNTHSTKDSSSNVTSNNINTKMSMLSKEFSETSTTMQPTASYTSRPFDITAKELNTQTIFSSGEIVLNKLTSEAPNEDRTTSLTTSDSTTDTSQSLNTTSAKSSLEISFMTVTKPENEIGHIYFQSTQKIITPLLPHGSTIITHQQIQIIQDGTPKTTNAKQRYGRRKISGKRRIVRPDRIPNIRERYTFLRPERKDVTTESTTMTTATAHKHYTSFAPLIEPSPLPAAMTTTVNPQHVPTTVYSTEETVTHSQDKQAFIETENKGEKTTHIFAEMKQPEAEIIEGFGSTVASSTFSTKANNFDSTVVSTPAPHTSNSINMSPTVPVQPSTLNIHLKSMPPTAKAKKSSKTLRGKIPWHRFFGNGQIQKEILKKLRKPKLQTSKAVTTILPTKTLIDKGTEAVSELDIPDLTTVAQLIRNNTATLASITESTILEKELPFIPSSTASSFMVPTSLQAHSSSQASPISNESNIKSYTTFSTMTATTTSDSNTSTETTAFNSRVVNSMKKKGLKRKRPRKKNTTTENLTSMQWKTSSGTQMTESLPVTTHSYTSITPTMPLANDYLYESVKGSSLVTTDLSKIPTTTFKFKTKVQTKPPTSQTSVTIDTNKMTVPNNSPSIITIMEPITTQIYMKKSINQTPLPPESAQTTSTRAAEKVQKKHVDTSANTKSQPKQPKKSNKYQSTTESKHTFIAELITSTPSYPVTTYALYTNMLHPTAVAPVTSATPQITNVPKSSSLSWKEILWNKPVFEMTQRSKTVIFNTLTILKPESLTSDTPVVQKGKYPKKNWSQKATNQETSTTNLVTLETLPSERPTKPKIKGGKLASFTVLANSDAFIPCEAMGHPVPTIHWTKVSSGTYLLKSRRGNKLEVFGNGTLSIPNVSIQDRGQYLCVAANEYGSDRLLVTLSVVAYPPRIIDGRSKEITVHAGNSVEVKCQAEGSPTPDIEWILANKSSVSEFVSESHRVTVKPDGSLVIKDVTIYDRGIYKCLANNPAGSDTLSVKIQVIAAPPIILESKREQVEGMLGENLKLPCTARGNPKPSVYWVLSDGTQVKPLHFINVKLFMFSNGTLYIRNVDSSDNGKYECIATSSTGSERRVITLTVEQRDTTPKIITASPKFTEKNFGDQLLLNCSADGEPKPKIIWRLPSKAVVDQWHRMGSRIQVYPNGSLYIEAVTEKDAGDYLCVARNKMGDDLILMRVSITLKPAKIDQKQYFKKQVPYGKDFKVDCKASGSPMPEISWSLPDGTMINNMLQADDNGRSRFRRYVLFENGTLFLNKVGITEEGDYTCVAQNTLGKDEMKVHITVVTAAPRIKQNYKTFASVKAGETATFDCEAIGEPRPRTFWLLPSGDMISASSDRYLLHVNGSLSITKVKLLDAGEHMCVARNPAGEDTKLYKLEVVSRPPLINGLYINKTVIKDTAVKHSRKLIDCRAEGTPTPHVMWIMPDNIFLNAPYYGSRIIVHKNGTLEIRNVRASDTAEFICVARNDGGETVLVVQLEATDMLRRPMFRNPFNEKITARPDRTAILNCSADGNPAPEMIWLLPNGTRFSPGQTLSRYHLGSDGTFFIHYPTKEDTGKYRCAAKNQVGYIEKLIILEVGQKPNILTHPKRTIKAVSGEQLSLHCLSDGVPKPNIMWTVPSGFTLDRPQINGRYTLHENGTLAVRETSIHDRGNYICRAHNNAGDMAITVPVMIIAYAPRITNRPPQSIRTKAGMPVQLSCIAIGIPKPEISWELPDHSVLSTASKGRPSGSELLHPQGTLVIQHPKRSDSGTYRCTATNSLGNDMSATFIQVI